MDKTLIEELKERREQLMHSRNEADCEAGRLHEMASKYDLGAKELGLKIAEIERAVEVLTAHERGGRWDAHRSAAIDIRAPLPPAKDD
jgi:hypothetical protein